MEIEYIRDWGTRLRLYVYTKFLFGEINGQFHSKNTIEKLQFYFCET